MVLNAEANPQGGGTAVAQQRGCGADDKRCPSHTGLTASYATQHQLQTMSSGAYDPYIPAGASSSNPTGESDAAPSRLDGAGQPLKQQGKTANLQREIDETIGVMRENIQKVTERGERLDALQDKTDNLAMSAQGFRKGANRVRKQMWWKDTKMKIIIGVGVVVLLIIIIVPIVKAFKN